MPPAVLKTVTGRSASTKAPPWSVAAVPAARDALILLHSFPFVNHLIRRKAFGAHLLPAFGNMIGFAAHTVVRAFMAFVRAAEACLMAQQMSPYLWIDHELEKSKVLGSRTDGYAPLEQRTSL